MLLAFIPDISTYKNTNKQRPYKAFQQWIEENNRFLYYTGENYQQSTNPVPYKIALGAKYLCKAVSVDTGIIIESLTSEDYILIDNFNTLKEEVRRELSNFSFKLHKEDIYYWNIWLRYPVNKQLEIAGLRGDIAFD